MTDYTADELNEALHCLALLARLGSVFEREVGEAIKVGVDVISTALDDLEHFNDKMGAK